MARDPNKVALARQMRGEGCLQREIAATLGISAPTASGWTRGVLPHGRRRAEARKLKVLSILARMYREGRSIKEIAASTGIPASTLFDWRRELDLPRNPRSVYVTAEMRERTRKQFTHDSDGVLKLEAARLYTEGKTSIEIAQQMRVTSATVCDWLRSVGITPRRSPTVATRQKLRAANLGAKRWNWKGGITADRVRLRASLDMKIARESCFERDGYACRCCGERGGKLNAHHIWPFQRFPEWRYEVWNLLTLCKRCHDAFHQAAGGSVRMAIGPFFAEQTEVREDHGEYRMAA
ncbi:MAG: HNH endonuclease [Steroidobacteraceae bacterium]